MLILFFFDDSFGVWIYCGYIFFFGGGGGAGEGAQLNWTILEVICGCFQAKVYRMGYVLGHAKVSNIVCRVCLIIFRGGVGWGKQQILKQYMKGIYSS